MGKENSFLKDFSKALIQMSGLAPVAGLLTPEAGEAREDQSGLLPEVGFTEGMRALTPSKNFGTFVGKAIAPPGLPFLVGLGSKPAIEARKDQSGFFPEFGISEAIRVANPAYDYTQAQGKGKSSFEVEPKISDKTIDTYEEFIDRTQNSPAMSAGVFDPKDLYQTYVQNQDFQAARGGGNLEKFAKKYPGSQTARRMRGRIPTSMDMGF